MNVPKPVLYLGCALIGFSLGSVRQFAFPHYRVYVHDIGVAGAHEPVFLKFDNREGRAWKSRGAELHWHEVFGEENLTNTQFTPPPLNSEEKPLRDLADN